MIYSITLNPALDLSGMVEDLVPNEKNYVLDEMRIAGGNGINASRIIKRLGKKTICSGFLGGSTGEEIASLLDLEKIQHRFIRIKGNTRTNITVSNQKTHNQTRLSFAGAKITTANILELERFIKDIKSPSTILVGGSLPPGIDTKKLARLIRTTKRSGHLCLVDCPGEILHDVIESQPFFIKPNLTEFQLMTRTKAKTINAVLKHSKKITDRIPLIVVSSVEGGALLVTKDQAWFGKIPPIKVKSTVGAGDSMVGAIASKISPKNFNNIDGESLLRLGLASSAATLSVPGITLGTKQDILRFFPKIKVSQL